MREKSLVYQQGGGEEVVPEWTPMEVAEMKTGRRSSSILRAKGASGLADLPARFQNHIGDNTFERAYR